MFPRGSFPFSLFWRPDKNTEAGQVCVYAHSVRLTILIASLRGWMNIKAFQIFKFWNSCERSESRAEDLYLCLTQSCLQPISVLNSTTSELSLNILLKTFCYLGKMKYKNCIYSSSWTKLLICKWNFSDVLLKASLWQNCLVATCIACRSYLSSCIKTCIKLAFGDGQIDLSQWF